MKEKIKGDTMINLKPSLGVIENGKHYFPVRVYYNHTDAGGIMYYANYFRIAEEARVAMFDVLASDDLKGYNDIKSMGDFVVRTAHAEYYKSAHFGEDLIIEDSIEEIGKVFVVVNQKVMRGDELLVEIKTKIVFVSVECGDHKAGCPLGGGGVVVGKPQRIPEFWMKKLAILNSK